MKLEKIYQYIDSVAPYSIQLDYDNSGLILGSMDMEVKRVLVALDVTMEVAKEAVAKKCQLIVSHHPLIFHGLRSITPGDPTGAVVLELSRHGVGVISAHTNLDQVFGGVSFALMKRLGVRQSTILEEAGKIGPAAYLRPYGMGAAGQMEEEMAPKDFVKHVKTALGAKGVRASLGNRPVKALAVCGGAGGDLLDKAVAWGADALVTADVKYHQFLEAYQRGITLVDAGHFATEDPAMDMLWDYLKCAFEDDGLEVLRSKKHKEVYFAP